MSKFRKRILFAIASIAVSIVGFDFAAQAQGTGSCLGSTSKPAISAIYLDNYAGLHSIGKKVWLQSVGDSQLVFHLCSVDDTKHYLIVRNDDANDFNPGKFSRFECTDRMVCFFIVSRCLMRHPLPKRRILRKLLPQTPLMPMIRDAVPKVGFPGVN